MSKKRKLDQMIADDDKPLDLQNDLNRNNNDESSIIKLNVGGFEFITLKSTLLNIDDTYFAKRFGGIFSMGPQLPNGAYFIDRDGTDFGVILNFMRDGGGNTVLPESKNKLNQLFVESEFYNITTLTSLIEEKIDSNESILTIKTSLSDIADCMNENLEGINSIKDSLETIASVVQDWSQNEVDVRIRGCVETI